MRGFRLLLIALVLLALAVLGGGAVALQDRPSLDGWSRLRLPAASPSAPGVRVTHAGVSTLVVTDGETTILIDGFFTRPSLARVAVGLVAPDEDAIASGLARLGVSRAAAVIVVHSHYDHVMDAPIVATRTGALLIGSESTANVARGLELPAEQIHVTRGADEELRFGAFTVRLLPSPHFPHGMAMGEITAPLVPPARANAYLEGGSFAVLLQHPAGRILVHASAGFDAAAAGVSTADVVLLGIAGLGTKPGSYRRDYWRTVVGRARPSLVVPIHWDDFTRQGTAPLAPMPRLLDDFEGTMTFLERRTAVPGAPALGLLPPWQPVLLLPRGSSASIATATAG